MNVVKNPKNNLRRVTSRALAFGFATLATLCGPAPTRGAGGHDFARDAFLDCVQARERALLPVVAVAPFHIVPTRRSDGRADALKLRLAEHLEALLNFGRLERGFIAGRVRRATGDDKSAITVTGVLRWPPRTAQNRSLVFLTVRCSHGDFLGQEHGVLAGSQAPSRSAALPTEKQVEAAIDRAFARLRWREIAARARLCQSEFP